MHRPTLIKCSPRNVKIVPTPLVATGLCNMDAQKALQYSSSMVWYQCAGGEKLLTSRLDRL